MPSAKDLQKRKKAILAYGQTGTGKTKGFTSLPGKKFLYLFDPSGIDTIVGHDLDYEAYFPEAQLGIRATQKGKTDPKAPKATEPMAYSNFENHLEKALDGGFEGYDIIGFDSLTLLQLILMDRLLYINGRLGRVPEIADYMLCGDTLMAIFKAVTAIPDKTIYVTAHSDLVQDEVSRKIINQLDTIKNVRRLLPRLMSDVWVTSAEMSTSGTKYYITTAPTKEYPAAKNSMSLNPAEDVTIKGAGTGIGRFLR